MAPYKKMKTYGRARNSVLGRSLTVFEILNNPVKKRKNKNLIRDLPARLQGDTVLNDDSLQISTEDTFDKLCKPKPKRISTRSNKTKDLSDQSFLISNSRHKNPIRDQKHGDHSFQTSTEDTLDKLFKSRPKRITTRSNSTKDISDPSFFISNSSPNNPIQNLKAQKHGDHSFQRSTEDTLDRLFKSRPKQISTRSNKTKDISDPSLLVSNNSSKMLVISRFLEPSVDRIEESLEIEKVPRNAKKSHRYLEFPVANNKLDCSNDNSNNDSYRNPIPCSTPLISNAKRHAVINNTISPINISKQLSSLSALEINKENVENSKESMLDPFSFGLSMNSLTTNYINLRSRKVPMSRSMSVIKSHSGDKCSYNVSSPNNSTSIKHTSEYSDSEKLNVLENITNSLDVKANDSSLNFTREIESRNFVTLRRKKTKSVEKNYGQSFVRFQNLKQAPKQAHSSCLSKTQDNSSNNLSQENSFCLNKTDMQISEISEEFNLGTKMNLSSNGFLLNESDMQNSDTSMKCYKEHNLKKFIVKLSNDLLKERDSSSINDSGMKNSDISTKVPEQCNLGTKMNLSNNTDRNGSLLNESDMQNSDISMKFYEEYNLKKLIVNLSNHLLQERGSSCINDSDLQNSDISTKVSEECNRGTKMHLSNNANSNGSLLNESDMQNSDISMKFYEEHNLKKLIVKLSNHLLQERDSSCINDSGMKSSDISTKVSEECNLGTKINLSNNADSNGSLLNESDMQNSDISMKFYEEHNLKKLIVKLSNNLLQGRGNSCINNNDMQNGDISMKSLREHNLETQMRLSNKTQGNSFLLHEIDMQNGDFSMKVLDESNLETQMHSSNDPVILDLKEKSLVEMEEVSPLKNDINDSCVESQCLSRNDIDARSHNNEKEMRAHNNSSVPDVIESSLTEDVLGFKNPTEIAKIVPLKAGKLWRRSFSIYKRNGNCCKLNTDRSCGCPNCMQSRQSTFLSNRRVSTRIVPASLNPATRETTILEQYALGTSYVQAESSEQVQLLQDNLENSFRCLSLRQNSILENNPVTAREIVLRKCGQTEPAPFGKCYPHKTLQNCQKIGEGVYGEVFLLKNPAGGTSVLKVIPIEGDLVVNGERQKKYEEILSEIIIATELHNLRLDTKNGTSCFPELQKVQCVRGRYPDKLLYLWDLYEETSGSENDCPDVFGESQLYIVLQLGNAGKDLEAYTFSNAAQAFSMFKQVAFGLAVAEESLRFEHRDLHWGNVLLNTVEKNKTVVFHLDGKPYIFPANGVEATIIDFTLSRIEDDGVVVFNDLALDPELFTADGDYQFEVYRLMQAKNGNNWQTFEPYTNVLWLHYILDKAVTGLRYKYVQSKIHKGYIGKMKSIREEILTFKSAKDFVSSYFATDGNEGFGLPGT